VCRHRFFARRCHCTATVPRVVHASIVSPLVSHRVPYRPGDYLYGQPRGPLGRPRRGPLDTTPRRMLAEVIAAEVGHLGGMHCQLFSGASRDAVACIQERRSSKGS